MKRPLVILEMANNHMGSISHGKKIIFEFHKLTKKYEKKINFAFKFQYRDEKSFIHHSYKNSDHSAVKRFETTFFNKDQWQSLLAYSKKYFDLICTPFDEISVRRVFRENFKFLKIASCSATDWPLLEEIANNYKNKNKNIIASLAGLKIWEISKLISFFTHKNVNIKYLYCVGNYPTKNEDINLDYFKFLRNRYGEIISGFSSHEGPKSYYTPGIAFGAGAKIFEKHVGVENSNFKLNKYSLSTSDLEHWLDNLIHGIEIWGSKEARENNLKVEISQLNNFKRGIYLKKNLKKNMKIKKNDYEICFPALENQVKANDLSKFQDIITNKNILAGKAILYKDIKFIDKRSEVEKIREKISNFLINKKVVIPKNSRLEISHHYGIENFDKYGITMINIINKKYCKKLIIMLPGQVHPEQFHKVKEESFYVLAGDVTLILDKKRYKLTEGKLKTILPKTIHKFYSKKGCIIEELSTKHKKSDSYYLDPKISNNKNRKSLISLY